MAKSTDKEQLSLFRALPALDMAPRDAQDLMSFPFFSLAKSRRVEPIHFHAGDVSLRVEGVAEHGIATIWDADVLIWAASQIVQARDQGLQPSRLMVATPHEILRFVQRGTGLSDYVRLKAALDRLQSTTVQTSIRRVNAKRQHRFSWIAEWQELHGLDADSGERSVGIELVLADWFFSGVMEDALVLTLDPAYFSLSGGIERWLYRLVRKHGGYQPSGWRFDFRHLHLRSGSLQRYADFALALRQLVHRQRLPGYWLAIERRGQAEWLRFRCWKREESVFNLSTDLGGDPVDSVWTDSGYHPHNIRAITSAGHGLSQVPIGRKATPSLG